MVANGPHVCKDHINQWDEDERPLRSGMSTSITSNINVRPMWHLSIGVRYVIVIRQKYTSQKVVGLTFRSHPGHYHHTYLSTADKEGHGKIRSNFNSGSNHKQGQIWRSYTKHIIQAFNITFVPCRSDNPFGGYANFSAWPLEFRVKFTGTIIGNFYIYIYYEKYSKNNFPSDLNNDEKNLCNWPCQTTSFDHRSIRLF